MCFYVFCNVKFYVHPVVVSESVNELVFALSSCVSATDLSMLRQRRKIGMSSHT